MTTLHVRTPLIESLPLSSVLGSRVFLKLECLQPTASFKLRGMGNSCQAACAAGAKRLVSSSGGNAGLAVAYAARHLGVPVTIVVPETTPPLMQDRLRAEGATVIQQGAAWDDAHAYALELDRAGDAVYIHPFDDLRVWTGNASLVHEVHDQGFVPDLVVTVVGGGGLLCGIVQGLHEAGWSGVPVVTVETEGASSYAQSVKAGRLVTLERITSLATTLGARTVCQRSLDWTSQHEIIPLVISDRSAVSALLRFADDHRLLVEPSCAAALAAVYERLAPLPRYRNVLVVVCGGAGVTFELVSKWVAQVGL